MPRLSTNRLPVSVLRRFAGHTGGVAAVGPAEVQKEQEALRCPCCWEFFKPEEILEWDNVIFPFLYANDEF